MDEAEKKYKAIVTKLQNDSGTTFILFELNGFLKKGITVQDINKDYVLNLKHLLLPTKIYKDAMKVLQKVGELQEDCMYSDTFLGDQIFASVMQPEIKKCIAALKKEELAKALTSLLGMFMVFWYEDGWVRDNESWMEKSFPKLFREYSLCWRIMLAKTDNELGLKCKNGSEGGYRNVIITLLQEQQESINYILADIDDCYEADQTDMHSRINILPLPEVPLTANDLPGRKPLANPKKRAPSQQLKPPTKKPRKPTHFWFSNTDSPTYRQQIINRYMQQWREDVCKWEEENKDYLKPKVNKKRKVEKKDPVSTQSKSNKKSKPSTSTKPSTKPSTKAISYKKSVPCSNNNLNEASNEETAQSSGAVTRSGRKTKPVNRLV